MTPFAAGVTPVWSDVGAGGAPATNFTYIIRAVGATGESADSKRMGEFDFVIVPGS